MDRILISACLIGQPVRYDGAARMHAHEAIVARWRDEGRLVPICPEVAAGFPTPRPPAEIQDGADGHAVLEGHARIVERTGKDVTALYQQAAADTVALAQQHHCTHAVLTDGSPSCGSTFIYDGTFSGTRHAQSGTTTAALRAAGLRVWAERDIADLDALLRGQPAHKCL